MTGMRRCGTLAGKATGRLLPETPSRKQMPILHALTLSVALFHPGRHHCRRCVCPVLVLTYWLTFAMLIALRNRLFNSRDLSGNLPSGKAIRIIMSFVLSRIRDGQLLLSVVRWAICVNVWRHCNAHFLFMLASWSLRHMVQAGLRKTGHRRRISSTRSVLPRLPSSVAHFRFDEISEVFGSQPFR